MKMQFSGNSFKYVILSVLISSFFVQACNSDKIEEESYYTFTGELVGQYLQARPDVYSEFVRLLDTTKVMSLLNAYGEYTCFAPDNEAMRAFYKEKGRNDLSEFPLDTLTKIAYDHIINGFVVPTDLFVEGRLTQKTMSDRYISISYASFNTGDLTIKVNKTAPILQPDIELHNGVIHEIGEVLKPSEKTLVEALSSDSKFNLFYQALVATGLDKELTLVEDESYDPDAFYIDQSAANVRVPKTRKYGFTAMVESDSIYATYGITNLDELTAYAKQIYDVVYPLDAGITDITDRKNSLNRFVAYHLINKEINYVNFIIHWDETNHSIKTYNMFEYIETMCPNTLMEVRTNRGTSETNLFNMVDPDDPQSAIRLNPDNYDNDAINGVYHEIDKILAYDFKFASYISSKRLRMDAASFFPEFMNNNIRGKVNVAGINSELWKFPPGYIERVQASEGTEFGYFNADDRYLDYQGDEVYLRGLYNFTITTPAVPAGTYEVRFGWKVETKRGAAQLYWDGIPCGIPLDLRIFATDPSIGYEVPGSNSADPQGFENDKMMRNRGYMKGPASFQAANTTWFTGNARINDGYLRRILGIYTFKEASTHTFTVVAARSGEFMFDFLEFVPVEVIESEGID
ncbi:fasciclin domain-containing protein [Saccharicrinis sp. FJH2]|uniref:fasciclin domain-containing protein n=1 Tax=Saccharicrinis sp. FJH65 TaxID=3344659 RepID=UPI0035F38C22